MKYAWCKEKSKMWIKTFLVAITFAGFVGCSNNSRPPYEYFPNMMDSLAVKAQKIGPDGVAMRTPVEGTIPINYYPYQYATDPEGAGKNLKNPLPHTREVMLRGQKYFNTYCIVCHGSRGQGDGFIIPKFPRPPSLTSDKVVKWPDGRIFHVITMGQNLMPSYASQVSVEERWAIIQYVRSLQ